MFKKVRKLFFAFLLAFLAVVFVGCGEECPEPDECDPAANAENCKDYCPAGQECDPAANKENCTEYCDECDPAANKENCTQYCDECEECEFIKLESFYFSAGSVKVGETAEVFLDETEFDPSDAYKELIWSSENTDIATVEEVNGKVIVTGVRPGTVGITAVSVLDPEITLTDELTVNDNLVGFAVAEREQGYILSMIPQYAAESFTFPGAWNSKVEVVYKDGDGNVVTGFDYPTELAKDTKKLYSGTIVFGEFSIPFTFSVWAVINNVDNCYVRVDQAISAAGTILKDYTGGNKLNGDVGLPATIFGVNMNWSSNNTTVLTNEGKFAKPLDDKAITLSITCQSGDYSKNDSFAFTAAGYDKAEKINYILGQGALAHLGGALNADGAYDVSTSTSLVLPAVDDTFKAKLSYVSSDETVIDNTGKVLKFSEYELDKDGNVKKDENGNVVFKTKVTAELTLTVKYDVSSEGNNFEETVKLAVLVLPANGAAQAAEKWLQESAYKEVVHFPYGKVAGNVLDVPTTYTVGEGDTAVTYNVKWNLAGAVVYPRVLATEKEEEKQSMNAFVLVEGKPKLVAQYIRYELVTLKATFVNPADVEGKDYASVTVVLNIGVSDEADYVYSGVWRSSAQKDAGLTEVQGKYDIVGNVSYFDKKLGHVTENYGSGYWSGYTLTSPEYNGHKWVFTPMELMTVYFRDDAEGNMYVDYANVTGGASAPGGNWGIFYVNKSTHDVKLEVGVYAVAGSFYGDGTTELASTVGSRVNIAMDGYAPGFVADATGKVLFGCSSDSVKLEYNMPNDRIKVGDDPLIVADSAKGTEINYVTVPAGGYAMSWKYQFYGVGSPDTLYAFCQKDAVLDIQKYEVNPLSSYSAEYAALYLSNAQKTIAAEATATFPLANNASIEANLNKARALYNGLTGDAKADVFAEADLIAAETAYAKLLDAEIVALLSKTAKSDFTTLLGKMNVRLNGKAATKTEAEVKGLSAEITALLTKKADFTTKYEELAAIDLTITYDFNGGYAMGLYAATDKEPVINLFLDDLYDFMLAQGAFKQKIDANGNLVDDETLEVPTRETFKSVGYWSTNYAQFAVTVLGQYLFEPAKINGEANPDYDKVKEGSNKFLNQAEYNKWVPLFDYVNEATQYANGAGQDAWGRNGDPYLPIVWLAKQPYYVEGSMYKDMTTVTSTNSGTLLGAYRFAQYICDASIHANYKAYIPHNVYSAIFDRQNTQERFSKQIYHCIDGDVQLLEAAYKEGYEFLGWFFEDGTKAAVNGAMFKDVAVHAEWLLKLEENVEKVAGKDLTPVYYGESADGFRKATPTGTLTTQNASVGIGDYAIVVGDQMFVLPKFSHIELGKEAAAATTITDKAVLQPYGVDADTNNSTGIIIVGGAPKNQDSYGAGALYENAGTFDLTFDPTLTYGRTLGGAAYGYERFIFSYDAEKKAYVGTKADTTSVTLKPGDFFWSPMTADRFCSGLTNCDGTSGVKGVLSDGVEVQIIDITGFVKEDVPFASVLFYDGDKLVEELYPENGAAFVKPADLTKAGFTFEGWGLSSDATEAVEVVLTPTEDATYYAIWKKADKFDAVTVNPTVTAEQTYATITEALIHCYDNATITVVAGTYDDTITIDKPVTIKGPYAGVAGYLTRDAAKEAVLTGAIIINADIDGVTIDGFKFTGASYVEETYAGTARKARIGSQNVVNFKFINNYIDNTPALFIQLAGAKDLVMTNNFFNFSAETVTGATDYWRPIRLDGSTENFTFEGNKYVQTAKNSSSSGFYDALYIASAKGVFNINENYFYEYCYNWTINFGTATALTELNVNGNTLTGDATDTAAGLVNVSVAGATNVNIKDNVLTDTVAGTTYSVKSTDTSYTGTITVQFNKFLLGTYKPRVTVSGTLVHSKNLVLAGVVTPLTDYRAVELTNDYTTEDAFKAGLYGTLLGSATITNYATGYVGGTEVYLSSSYIFNKWYNSKQAVKFNAAKGIYEIIGDQQDTATLEYGKDYDFLIAVHDSCVDTAAKTLIGGLPVGTVVEFSGMSQFDFGTLQKGAVTITVNFYTPAA